jgi:hypothetical protein
MTNRDFDYSRSSRQYDYEYNYDDDYGRERGGTSEPMNQDYRYGSGRQGSNQGYGSQPMTWSYTEIWLIPGPQTGKGPRNYQRSDDRICEDVSERLTQHGQLDASNIEVDVQNGEVTLKGTVNSRKEKRMAEDTADSVSGVKDVHNQLKIEQQGEKGQQGQQRNQQSQQQRQPQGQQSFDQQRQAGQNQPQTQQQQPQGQTQNQR